MNIINQTPSVRLGKLAPKQVFLGLPAYNPFNVLYAPHLNTLSPVPLEQSEIKEAVSRLQHSLEMLHQPIRKRRDDRRHTQQHAKLRNRTLRQFRAHELGINLSDLTDDDCDFVLVAQARLNTLSKLTALWRGPYRIVRAISAYVYEVEHLVTHEFRTVHITRLRFYADSSLDIPIPLLDELLTEDTLTFEYHIESILAHTYDFDSGEYRLRIKWTGFSDLETTWEPLNLMYEDQPKRICQYLMSLPDSDTFKADMLRTIDTDE